jgi:hypothetical protein
MITVYGRAVSFNKSTAVVEIDESVLVHVIFPAYLVDEIEAGSDVVVSGIFSIENERLQVAAYSLLVNDCRVF